ncbi:GM24159 [Drosophila sechellia]|uniref:GM24159 n=1 Tax=Drosophila sechellia TaxID=7238 RepID=B4HEP3_DROSE|nr:GM24159 [Drosophila sechellia]
MAKPRSSVDAAGNGSGAVDAEAKLNYFQKLWRYRHYLVIEPFFFFYFMASVFNAVAMQNFPLDKACRVNLGYNKLVCDTMLDKSELGIECDDFDFENTTQGATPDLADQVIGTTGFNYTVCKADWRHRSAADSQETSSMAAIFPLIVLLFAGGWADRYNKRKPCMIMPIIGEALSFTCQIISSIFFESLPMEFGAYCEAIVPALFGGLTFCLMAIYSYITIATPEEDRVFRFGIFAMFVTGVPFIGQPISGVLFTTLGYTWSFASAIAFQLIAIFYIIFFIKEVKTTPTTSTTANEPPPLPTTLPPKQQGADNMAYETTNLEELQGNKNVNFQLTPQMEPKVEVVPPKRSALKELFDPTLVLDCIRFPLIKRPNNGRMLLILLLCAYFLTVGPTSGENDYWYRFTLKKLAWNGNDFSIYLTLSSGAALVGTFIGTAILSKLLKVSDSMIGMLSALSIVCSRVLFAFSSSTSSFYVAGVVDMFVSLRVIAIKTIGSSIVAGDELSKMYSIFGISEPIAQFIFPPVFSEIYKSTVDSFPGAIWLFGEIFYIPNVLVFVVCYFLLRRRKANEEKSVVEMEQNGGESGGNRANVVPDSEITSL